jgi:hypothetical protein
VCEGSSESQRTGEKIGATGNCDKFPHSHLFPQLSKYYHVQTQKQIKRAKLERKAAKEIKSPKKPGKVKFADFFNDQSTLIFKYTKLLDQNIDLPTAFSRKPLKEVWTAYHKEATNKPQTYHWDPLESTLYIDQIAHFWDTVK